MQYMDMSFVCMAINVLFTIVQPSLQMYEEQPFGEHIY